MVPCALKSPKWVPVPQTNNATATAGSKASSISTGASLSHPPLRVAVLGAGFAGLSVVWHLLKLSPPESHLSIDLYDESGIGGGASGVAGGLLHPYSPKVKLLWRGAECWKECLNLISNAEAAASSRKLIPEVVNSKWNLNNYIVCRRGIVRPAMDAKKLDVLTNNAEDCLQDCRIESLSKDAARNLVPNIRVPFNSVFYMPEALTIHPLHYLQALFLSCEDMVESTSGCKELHLHKKSIEQLCDLTVAGTYDEVIVCLGAKVDFLPELSGRLPLRTCRGVIAHLQLSDNFRESYPDYSPSILSNAWLAFPGPRSLYVGSTWEWGSRNYSQDASSEEASQALEELLPKAAVVYPKIDDWSFIEAKAGLRAMPPLTSHGLLPLLGSIDEYVERDQCCKSKYWLFGGLGARGLLYHGLLGRLMAHAVLCGDETSLPCELTSWKKLKS